MPPEPEKALSVNPQAAGSTRQMLRVRLLGEFALWLGQITKFGLGI